MLTFFNFYLTFLIKLLNLILKLRFLQPQTLSFSFFLFYNSFKVFNFLL